MSPPLTPSRVLVTAEGCALPPRMAKSRYGVEPDIVFYRDDGWALGSPIELAGAAYKLWSGRWTSYQRRGESNLRPISEYRKEQRQ